MEIMEQILQSTTFNKIDSEKKEITEKSQAAETKANPVKVVRELKRAGTKVLDLGSIVCDNLLSSKGTPQDEAPYKKFLSKIQTIKETVTSKEKEKEKKSPERKPMSFIEVTSLSTTQSFNS